MLLSKSEGLLKMYKINFHSPGVLKRNIISRPFSHSRPKKSRFYSKRKKNDWRIIKRLRRKLYNRAKTWSLQHKH